MRRTQIRLRKYIAIINPDLTPLEQRKSKALRQQLADLNKDSNNAYIIKTAQ